MTFDDEGSTILRWSFPGKEQSNYESKSHNVFRLGMTLFEYMDVSDQIKYFDILKEYMQIGFTDLIEGKYSYTTDHKGALSPLDYYIKNIKSDTLALEGNVYDFLTQVTQ